MSELDLISSFNKLTCKDEFQKPKEMEVNRGTGAGGANTNKNGKSFEEKTSFIPILEELAFIRKEFHKSKFGFYYNKTIDNKEFYFFTQSGLKKFLEEKFQKYLFRDPDEAMLIKENDKYILKILEKKNQNAEGSVIDKLCNAGYFIKEYNSCLDQKFTVEYSFCLSQFLKDKYTSDSPKFNVMRKIHNEEKINVFFGSDSDYFEKVKEYYLK
jgi:hypothetical protein